MSLAAVGVVIVSLWVGVIPLVSGFRTYRYISGSMENTFAANDVILVDLHAYRRVPILHGDVIAIQHGDYVLIKRVIGLPSDIVSIDDSVVSVNGKPLSEPYAQHTGELGGAFDHFGPVTVAPGRIFLLGDNRDHSLDSRMPEFGELLLTDVKGKALYVLRSDHGGRTHPIQ